MPVEARGIRMSPLDTHRFGVVTARVDDLGAAEVAEAMAYCQAHDVELLIARAPIEDLEVVHRLGAAGFELMDTLVYYERDLRHSPVIEPADVFAAPADTDVDQVEAIARECFRQYSGHYHADSRLDREACREVYASWARNACLERSHDSFVLVVGEPDHRVGFSCFRRPSAEIGELVLGAVLPEARGQKLYTRLTLAGAYKLQTAGATRFITSTHLGNWAAEAAWSSAGLRPYRAYHTFHRWFGR